MRTILLVAFIAFVFASPAKKVEHDLHDIAKSVKSSSQYSLEEKKTILSNLKEMNKDAEELAESSGEFKKELKHDLQERLNHLKSEMHEQVSVNKRRSFEEEEEAITVARVHAVHDDLKGLKKGIFSQHLSASQKTQAKRLIKELETQYGQLSHETTKEGRKRVAHQMKDVSAALKKIVHPTASLESKKEAIRSKIEDSEARAVSEAPAAMRRQIHSKFEHMKRSLETETSTAVLQSKLKADLANIKEMAHKDEEEDLEEHSEKDFEEEQEEEESESL